jgi:O-antigen/teichoic acid export membrane protein
MAGEHVWAEDIGRDRGVEPAPEIGDQKLGRRVVRAGAWNLGLNVSTGILSLVRIVVLARLLTPRDFGIFSIALVAVAAFDAFTQTGFESALIQKKSEVMDYLDTVWVVQVIRAVFIALALFLLAHPAASWFGESAASPMLQLVALAPLLKGFENVGTVLLPRELEFDKQFRLSISESITDIAVSIGAALIWRDALALITGLVAGRAVRVLVSYLIHDYRPRLRFEITKFRDLQRFGRWVFLNNVIFFFAVRGDKAVVGKLLGPILLGAYEIAWRVSEVVTRSISNVVAEVVFPTYAKIQDQPDRLHNAYLAVLESVAPIVIPAGMVLAVIARPLVTVMLGPTWAPISEILPLLAWSGVIRSIAGTGGSLYMAVGKPYRDFTMNFVRVVVTFGLMVPLVDRGGLVGAAQAIFIGTLAVVPPFIYWVRAITGVTTRRLLVALAPACGLAVVVALPVWLLPPIIGDGALVGTLGVALCMAGAYAAFSVLLWKIAAAGPLQHLARIMIRVTDDTGSLARKVC